MRERGKTYIIAQYMSRGMPKKTEHLLPQERKLSRETGRGKEFY